MIQTASTAAGRPVDRPPTVGFSYFGLCKAAELHRCERMAGEAGLGFGHWLRQDISIRAGRGRSEARHLGAAFESDVNGFETCAQTEPLRTQVRVSPYPSRRERE